MSQKPLIVIVGPTAVGKSALSVELALKLKSEIVSADSMQVYKMMDIGTAKSTIEEQKGIKHYLIDEIDPSEEFSVARYKELADGYINKILSKSKIPIMVGGTGLYVNSAVNNIQFSETVGDSEYRNGLQEIAQEKGNQHIFQMLKEIDPIASEKIHENDIKRVIRALEVYKFTGIPMSKHIEQSKRIPSDYNLVMIGLTMDRPKLYERINKRVDFMLEQGLVQEVQMLVDKGYNKEMTSMQGIGYKEIIDYLSGKLSLAAAVEIIKRESRRYAKRQLTWFRRDERIHWIDTEEADTQTLLKEFLKYIAHAGII